MQSKIRWGIWGLGKMARKFATDLQVVPDAVLGGVASRSTARARAFGRQYAALQHYGSYDELIQNPEIDIVYIATPHPFHFENTIRCLQQGKAVLCEKPLGMKSTEVKAMIEEAQKRQLFLMEGLWTRFIPITELLLQLLQEKAIGDILSVTADFGIDAAYNAQSRLYNPELGGGSLLDLGIYPIYLSRLALGSPTSIKALAHRSSTGVDESCAMVLKHENGAIARLATTFAVNTANEAHFFGKEGWMKVHAPFHHSQKLTLKSREHEKVYSLPYQGNGYVHEIERVQQCLRDGLSENPQLPLQTSLDLISTLDRVREQMGLKYPL